MVKNKIFVRVSDDTRLLTYVFLPGDGKGKYPVLLVRNPYCQAPDPNEPDTVESQDYGYCCSGFALVEQRCRGQGGSEGKCIPFMNERSDGLDTIAWIEKQPWFDGRIYLIGGSYLTYVHLSYMDSLPESVKGASLAVMPTNGNLAFFKNGVYKADVGPGWYPAMVRPEGFELPDVYKEWEKFPMSGYMERVFGYDVPEFTDTVKLKKDPAACPGAFSDALNAMRNCRVPVLLSDGWTEMFFDGMVSMWNELPEETRKKSAFMVGPWSHDLHVSPEFVYNFENGAFPENFELEWLLHLRDGKELKNFREGMVRYYHIGKGEWRFADNFPSVPASLPMYLDEDSVLSGNIPEDGSVTYTYDPLDPPSFPGGPNTFCRAPWGYAKQPEANFRSDVKSFISAPLDNEITLEGKIRVELEVSSTAPATAFIARICCTEENGNTTIMQDCPIECDMPENNGRRIVSGETGNLCWTLRRGERMRVDISSADAHSYSVHTNYPGEQFFIPETRKADNTIYFGKSRVVLPAAE